MVTNPALYGSYADDILAGVTPTGTAPSTTYSLATFQYGNPVNRIRWGTTTVTITWTLGSSKTGGVLIIPMHNFTPGSTTVVTLTNGAGLSKTCTIPALEANGLPPTLAVDFSLSGSLSSNVWNLVIVSNSANVIMGGAVSIYPKKAFSSVTSTGSVTWQATEEETGFYKETINEYGTPFVQDYATAGKTVTYTAVTDAAGAILVKEWFRGNHGRARCGFFWADPSVTTEAYFGRWQNKISVTRVVPKKRAITITLDEWPKGQAI